MEKGGIRNLTHRPDIKHQTDPKDIWHFLQNHKIARFLLSFVICHILLIILLRIPFFFRTAFYQSKLLFLWIARERNYFFETMPHFKQKVVVIVFGWVLLVNVFDRTTSFSVRLYFLISDLMIFDIVEWNILYIYFVSQCNSRPWLQKFWSNTRFTRPSSLWNIRHRLYSIRPKKSTRIYQIIVI